jgi:hypothetical protein
VHGSPFVPSLGGQPGQPTPANFAAELLHRPIFMAMDLAALGWKGIERTYGARKDAKRERRALR